MFLARTLQCSAALQRHRRVSGLSSAGASSVFRVGKPSRAPFASKRLYATHSSHEGEGVPPGEDDEAPDGATAARRELIKQAKAKMEDEYGYSQESAKAEDEGTRKFWEDRAKQNSEYINQRVSENFWFFNRVAGSHAIVIILSAIVGARLAHFIYQSWVQAGLKNMATDYEDMSKEDGFKEIQRPGERPLPAPTAQRVPPVSAVAAPDTSALRAEVDKLAAEREVLEKKLSSKKQELAPDFSITAPVEKMAYAVTSFLAVLKTFMSWPTEIHVADTILEDTRPDPGKLVDERFNAAVAGQKLEGYEKTILGKLPGPNDAVYGRPITLMLDTELLLAPVLDKDVGMVTVKRPAIEHFISRVAPHAEIVLISPNFTPEESQTICEKLDPYNFRAACLSQVDTWKYKYRTAKPLDGKKLGRPQSRIVAFDRDYELCGQHCDNVLLLTQFYGSRSDTALIETIPFIQFLSLAAQQGRDVREIISHYRGVPIDKAVRFMNEMAEAERKETSSLVSKPTRM